VSATYLFEWHPSNKNFKRKKVEQIICRGFCAALHCVTDANLMPTRVSSSSLPRTISIGTKDAKAPTLHVEAKSSGWTAKRTTSVAGSSAQKSLPAGPISELENMSAIVVANPDGYGPTQNLHESLGKALPNGTKLIVLQAKDHTDAWSGKAPKGSVAIKTAADSPWARDFAPTFVRTKEGKLEAVEFKYFYPGADGIAASIAKKMGVPVRSSPLVVEGGNLLADQGRLFVTTKLLETNKGMTKAQVESELKSVLHIDHVEWMTPLPGEATGHIDMYAKLVAPQTMLVSDTKDLKQKAVMDAAAKRFEALGYKVLRALNAPTDQRSTNGGAQTRSYANALVVNGTAFVPQYLSGQDVNDGRGKNVAALDKMALETYRKAGLNAVGVPASALIGFEGSVHCMTNTIPAGLDLTRLK
jgi:agmatine deiminase